MVYKKSHKREKEEEKKVYKRFVGGLIKLIVDFDTFDTVIYEKDCSVRRIRLKFKGEEKG